MLDFFLNNPYSFFSTIIVMIIIISFSYFSKISVKKKYHQKLEEEVKKQVIELRAKDELLIAQSKLAAVGESLAHISHQWKQPLSQINSVVLNIEADYENEELSSTKLEEHLNEIEKLTFYMSDTINSFNNYLEPNKKEEIFSMKDAFEDAFALVYRLYESKRIECSLNIEENSFIKGVKKEFVQALLVILNNAKDVLEEREIRKRKIKIRIYIKENKSVMEISDNAGGIEEKYFKKIFDPYFTTKPHSQGTGHGLCMAKMIIEKSMHGTLNVKNDKKGAKFCILLASKNKKI